MSVKRMPFIETEWRQAPFIETEWEAARGLGRLMVGDFESREPAIQTLW